MIQAPEKVYYSIKEVSEMLDVPMPTLRFWEHAVKQLQPRVNSGRTRMYSKEDIDLIRKLIYLRSQNVPVKDWSTRISQDNRNLDRKAAARENLLLIKEELIALRSLL